MNRPVQETKPEPPQEPHCSYCKATDTVLVPSRTQAERWWCADELKCNRRVADRLGVGRHA